MSKFCPEPQCEFWEDFPDGFPGKKAKICPYCSQILLTEKPRQDEIRTPCFIPEGNEERTRERQGKSAGKQKEFIGFSPNEDVNTTPLSLDSKQELQDEHSPVLPLPFLVGEGDSISEQEKKLPISHPPVLLLLSPKEGHSASEQEKKIPISPPPVLLLPSPGEGNSASEQEKKLPISPPPVLPLPSPEEGHSASEQEKKLPISPPPVLPLPSPEEGHSVSEQEKKLPISPPPVLPLSSPEEGHSVSEQERNSLYHLHQCYLYLHLKKVILLASKKRNYLYHLHQCYSYLHLEK